MRVQLTEYSKLVQLQDEVLRQHQDEQRAELTRRQGLLEAAERQAVDEERRAREGTERARLGEALEQGRRRDEVM